MALAFAVTQRFARSLRWVVVHHHRSSWTELQTDAMVGHCDLDLGLSTVPRWIDEAAVHLDKSMSPRPGS
jgi:hypothetical protein